MSDLVQRAREYATRAHERIDQRRKYSGEPYQVHLQAIADTVAEVGGDEEMIAAAWLHDTVEDTAATHQDIEDAFGPGVAQLVRELTDVSRPSDGPRTVRKAIDREHLAQASARAQTIKLADLIDNAEDICHHDPRFARTYLGEMAALLEVLDRGHPELRQRARRLLHRCEERLGLIIPVEDIETEPGYREALGFGRRRVQRLFNDAFVARDIAEPLPSFDHDREPQAILAAMQQHGHSVAGIRRNGLVQAHVRRIDLEDLPERLPARRFARDQILPGDAGLPEVVAVLTRHQHCFVTTFDAIAGVITRYEMERPLVRMWLFGMVTMLEMRFVEMIEQRWPDEAWTGLLSEGRLEKARQLQQERSRRGQPVRLLDCLQFSDKGQLVIRDAGYRQQLELGSRAEGKEAIRQLESLRNHLAHSQPITTRDWPQIVRMTRLVADT